MADEPRSTVPCPGHPSSDRSGQYPWRRRRAPDGRGPRRPGRVGRVGANWPQVASGGRRGPVRPGPAPGRGRDSRSRASGASARSSMSSSENLFTAHGPLRRAAISMSSPRRAAASASRPSRRSSPSSSRTAVASRVATRSSSLASRRRVARFGGWECWMSMTPPSGGTVRSSWQGDALAMPRRTVPGAPIALETSRPTAQG